MKNTKVERIRQKAIMFGRQFLQSDSGVFDQAFERSLTTMVRAQVPSHRERIYAPLDRLGLFVGQVLSADRACQDLVGRWLSECIAQGESEGALTTGSYCDTRQRLPLAVPPRIPAMYGNAQTWQTAVIKLSSKH